MFNVELFRQHFPVLSTKVNGKDYYYFDSAATSLKPKSVADRLHHYYLYEAANIHRGSHYLGRLGTENFEAVRVQACQFVNARSSDEIVFVKGVTEAINLLAYSYGQKMTAQDTVVLSMYEHHSNIVPWHLLRERTSCKIEVLKVNNDGSVSADELARIKCLNPKIVSMIMYSNVTGVRLDIEGILNEFKNTSTITIVDAAQAVLHEKIDVQKIDCDYLTFSAHKMFGPFGVGVLYGKKQCLEECPPFMGGGSMISQVQWNKIVLQNPPHKFEAGTPSVADVIGFGVAIDFMNMWSINSWVEHTQALVSRVESEINHFSRIRQVGPNIHKARKADIVSFVFDGAHSSDVGEVLDQMGVAVRTGHHCAQPLMSDFGITGTVRLSFGPYNSQKDVDYLLEALQKVGTIL